MKLPALAAAWLGGLALAYRWYDADPTPALLLALFALTLALICRLLRISPWPALLIALLLLGLWRYELAETSLPSLLAQSGQPSAFQGRIVNDPGVHHYPRQVPAGAIGHRPGARQRSEGGPAMETTGRQNPGLRPSPGVAGTAAGTSLFPLRRPAGTDRNAATTPTLCRV